MVVTEELDRLEEKEALEDPDHTALRLLVTASDLMVLPALDKALARMGPVEAMVGLVETVETEELELEDGQWRLSQEEELLSRPSAMSGNLVDQETLVPLLLLMDLLQLDQERLVFLQTPRLSLIALNSALSPLMTLSPASSHAEAVITLPSVTVVESVEETTPPALIVQVCPMASLSSMLVVSAMVTTLLALIVQVFPTVSPRLTVVGSVEVTTLLVLTVPECPMVLLSLINVESAMGMIRLVLIVQESPTDLFSLMSVESVEETTRNVLIASVFPTVSLSLMPVANVEVITPPALIVQESPMDHPFTTSVASVAATT